MQLTDTWKQRPLAMRIFALLAVTVFLMASSGTAAWAQSTQGTILGEVKDTKGALVPNAVITLTSNEEGNVR